MNIFDNLSHITIIVPSTNYDMAELSDRLDAIVAEASPRRVVDALIWGHKLIEIEGSHTNTKYSNNNPIIKIEAVAKPQTSIANLASSAVRLSEIACAAVEFSFDGLTCNITNADKPAEVVAAFAAESRKRQAASSAQEIGVQAVSTASTAAHYNATGDKTLIKSQP